LRRAHRHAAAAAAAAAGEDTAAVAEVSAAELTWWWLRRRPRGGFGGTHMVASAELAWRAVAEVTMAMDGIVASTDYGYSCPYYSYDPYSCTY